GGAQAANIFWLVGSSATLGTNSAFKGNILADQSITLMTGATLEGRALARTGAVAIDGNTITIPSAISGLVLESAGAVTGPYADTPGQSVDLAAKVISVPLSGGMQYYRIRSNTAVTITGITIFGGNVLLTYH
ncbi:MAG: DUF3494 domain-containing protein, partial [Verrucomicrobia bacterium]